VDKSDVIETSGQKGELSSNFESDGWISSVYQNGLERLLIVLLNVFSFCSVSVGNYKNKL
jgi:hypothetical protein